VQDAEGAELVYRLRFRFDKLRSSHKRLATQNTWLRKRLDEVFPPEWKEPPPEEGAGDSVRLEQAQSELQSDSPSLNQKKQDPQL